MTRMSGYRTKLPLALFLLVAQLIPPIPLYLSITSSMALGMMIAGILVAITAWALISLATSRPIEAAASLFLLPVFGFAILSAFLLLHFAVADSIQPGELNRCALSLIPLGILIVGGMTMGRSIRTSKDKTVDIACRISLYTLSVVALLQFVGLQPRPEAFPKSIFPYTETSHFALAFTPIFMYRCVRYRDSQSSLLLALGFGLGIALQSLALLIGCILTAVVCRRLPLLILGSVAFVVVGLPLQYAYFSDRLDFSGAVLNLSNLVYIQGWEFAADALTKTHGWGLGFQQLGVRPAEVATSPLIRALTEGIDPNVTDGSFVLSKLISEFGIIGIALGITYVGLATASVRALRAGGSRNSMTLARCIVVSYAVDMFVRGTGYFVESTFMFVAALSAMFVILERPSEAASPPEPSQFIDYPPLVR